MLKLTEITKYISNILFEVGMDVLHKMKWQQTVLNLQNVNCEINIWTNTRLRSFSVVAVMFTLACLLCKCQGNWILIDSLLKIHRNGSYLFKWANLLLYKLLPRSYHLLCRRKTVSSNAWTHSVDNADINKEQVPTIFNHTEQNCDILCCFNSRLVFFDSFIPVIWMFWISSQKR